MPWINFNLLSAAACQLDTSHAAVLMEPDQAARLRAAMTHIVQEGGCLPASAVHVPRPDSIVFHPEPLSVLVLKKMKAQERSVASAANSADYSSDTACTDAAEGGAVRALDCWSSRRATYSCTPCHLPKTSLQLQHLRLTFECVFSLCGLLTAGQRNRMSQVLWSQSISEAECTHRTLASTVAEYCWTLLWTLMTIVVATCCAEMWTMCIWTGIKFRI